MSDETDWDNEKYARKINQLRTTNAGLAQEIEALGSGVDLSMARLEHLVSFLVGEGIITEGQQVREQYAWEKGLRPQLIAIRDRVRSHLERARARQEKMAKDRLRATEKQRGEAVDSQPSKPSLILPPGAKK